MNDQYIENTLAELKTSSRTSLVMVILGALCILGSLYFSATRLTPLEKKNAELTEILYNRAVSDAAVAEQVEISDRLFAINPDNKALKWKNGKVLVVSWKSKSSYESNYKNQTHTAPQEKYVTWVTAVPQLQSFCQEYVQNNPRGDLNQRLIQYLGLNPDWDYEVFLEMWVDPEDMFRPCVDPQIDDSSCQLKFAEDPVPQVKRIADYPVFYKNLYFKNFRYSPRVPWTGLGYVYDWGNPSSSIGASEYILSPNSAYQIERVVETAEYCR